MIRQSGEQEVPKKRPDSGKTGSKETYDEDVLAEGEIDPADWLNQAEIELSLASRQCLGTRRIPDLARLTSEIRAWNTRAHRHRTKIRWTFTRTAARSKFGYVKNRSRRSQA